MREYFHRLYFIWLAVVFRATKFLIRLQSTASCIQKKKPFERFERSNGLDIALYKTIPLPFISWPQITTYITLHAIEPRFLDSMLHPIEHCYFKASYSKLCNRILRKFECFTSGYQAPTTCVLHTIHACYIESLAFKPTSNYMCYISMCHRCFILQPASSSLYHVTHTRIQLSLGVQPTARCIKSKHVNTRPELQTSHAIGACCIYVSYSNPQRVT